jgi:hypothetical protein
MVNKPALLIRYGGEDWRRVFKTRTEALSEARLICGVFQYPSVEVLHEDGKQETVKRENL